MIRQTSRRIVVLIALSLAWVLGGSVTVSEAAGPLLIAKKGKAGPPHAVAHGHGHQGPPAHAPAHGYRHKHKYHYYPSHNVYYAPDRKLYFYLQGDGWKTSAELPTSIRLNLGESTSLELDTDIPYKMLIKD